jgi:outer membrane murein-binding lipoprotein Lpp
VSASAELSSIATDLDELAARVADLASTHERAKREDVSSPLHEAERALRAGYRHVSVALKALAKS